MDDGSRTNLHFLGIAHKPSTAVRFEEAAPSASGQAKAFLTALTESRNEFTLALEATSAEADSRVEEAASAYFPLLLGLVNTYGHGPDTPALDQETGPGRCKACFAQQ